MSRNNRHKDSLSRWANILLWVLCFAIAILSLTLCLNIVHEDTLGLEGDKTAEFYDIHGIDVSHHQGKINWDKVMKATVHNRHISFVFVKCSEGCTRLDKHYRYNQRELRKRGILFSAYHYYIPGRPIERQARNFIENSHLRKGDLPPVLDVEETGKLSNERLVKDVITWMEIVGKHYNCTPILYASHSFLNKHLHDERLTHYPYWKSRYMNNGVITGKRWVFYQYTRHGHIAGIKDGVNNYVDLNVFNGTPEDLQSLRLDF